MTLDPATTQAFANVFGGGLAGAIIFVSLLGNAAQYMLARRDRDRSALALERSNAEHLATAKTVAGVAQDLALALERRTASRRRQSQPPAEKAQP